MRVAFVASFAPIVPDPSASGSFYSEALGLSLDGAEGAYRFTEQLDGVKHFGLWPLAEAAQACFGTAEWPSDVSRPQASIEFEVESVEAVAAAASELAGTGLRLLHAARTEPWGQTVTRLLSPEGLVVGVCYTPQFHGNGHDGG
jgi:catechol 2,3-dioxygenase-like lactoylglutathione lyase family enzyme